MQLGPIKIGCLLYQEKFTRPVSYKFLYEIVLDSCHRQKPKGPDSSANLRADSFDEDIYSKAKGTGIRLTVRFIILSNASVGLSC